uniref:Uncharacterized protein n=1 Tax=Cynoglossus semilaevis TaxID=244447 RepID=A0A3P8X3S3_CYNSE
MTPPPLLQIKYIHTNRAVHLRTHTNPPACLSNRGHLSTAGHLGLFEQIYTRTMKRILSVMLHFYQTSKRKLQR